jgi:asparagine synthase (glutamine-hydrolysing)
VNTLNITRYWDWDFSHARTTDEISFAEASEETRRLFEQAVTRQLVSDVPVGAYLSGGMDSGSIVAVASRVLPGMPTFTGGFDLSSVSGLEVGFDERKRAEEMASAFRTQQYEMVMHSGDMARVLPHLTWHIEDLRMGMSYANWYAAHLASKFVKVVLSGTGGDELFAGYPWRYQSLLTTTCCGEFNNVAYQYWQRLLPDRDKVDFFTPAVMRQVSCQSTFEVLKDVLSPLRQNGTRLCPESALNRALYFEAKTFLHGLLILEDKISMAQGMEVRVPFLDNDLVDFVLSLPAKYKANIPNLVSPRVKGLVYSSDGKRVLRDAMKGIVPDTTLNRAKQGFSSPDGSWYRGETMAYVKDILLCPKTLDRGYFQPAYIRKVVEEHLGGKVNHRLLIWSLLSFEHWSRLFMDGKEVYHG